MNYLEIIGNPHWVALSLVRIPGKYLSVDSRYHNACHLYFCVLQSRTIRRFWYQYLLSSRSGLWLAGMEVRQ